MMNSFQWEVGSGSLSTLHRIHFHYGMRVHSFLYPFSFLAGGNDNEECEGGGKHEIDATHNATDKTNA